MLCREAKTVMEYVPMSAILAKMQQVQTFGLFVFLLFILPFCYDGCRVGQTVTSVTVFDDGKITLNCSDRLYPICDDIECFWTNLTCELDDRTKRTEGEKRLLANIKKPYRRKAGKNEAKINDDIDSEGVRRRCCHSSSIHVINCRMIHWSPNPFKNGSDTFYIAEYGAKHLACRNRAIGVIRDVIIEEGFGIRLIMEICCLIYDEGPVYCKSSPKDSPRGGGGGGGGGYLEIGPNCKCSLQSTPDVASVCIVPETQYSGISVSCCCQICASAQYGSCYWSPDSGGTCHTCPPGQTGYNTGSPGTVYFIGQYPAPPPNPYPAPPPSYPG